MRITMELETSPVTGWSTPRLTKLGTIADVANNNAGAVQNVTKGS